MNLYPREHIYRPPSKRETFHSKDVVFSIEHLLFRSTLLVQHRECVCLYIPLRSAHAPCRRGGRRQGVSRLHRPVEYQTYALGTFCLLPLKAALVPVRLSPPSVFQVRRLI